MHARTLARLKMHGMRCSVLLLCRAFVRACMPAQRPGDQDRSCGSRSDLCFVPDQHRTALRFRRAQLAKPDTNAPLRTAPHRTTHVLSKSSPRLKHIPPPRHLPPSPLALETPQSSPEPHDPVPISVSRSLPSPSPVHNWQSYTPSPIPPTKHRPAALAPGNSVNKSTERRTCPRIPIPHHHLPRLACYRAWHCAKKRCDVVWCCIAASLTSIMYLPSPVLQALASACRRMCQTRCDARTHQRLPEYCSPVAR